jgi:signal transduction histidine kinase
MAKSEISKRFFSSDEEEPGFGFTSSVYWVRLMVNNPQDKLVNWYLEIEYPLLDYINLYILDGEDRFIVKKTGDRLRFNSREVNYRNFVFDLTETPNSVTTYYLRFQTSSSMNFPLKFWLKKTFFDHETSEIIILGIFYGAVIIMIIYNAFLFIGFLDKSYVYNVLFITSWGLAQLSLNGLAFQYIWPNCIWWANVNIPFFIFASVLTSNQFARSLLITKKNAPLWDKILNVKSILFGIGMILSLTIPYAITIRLASASGFITVVALLLTAIQCLRFGVRTAYFFLVAWGFYFFGVILFALKSFGVLPSNFITNWSIQVGAFALLVLFSIAVQDRINRERREKFLAQKSALENEQKLVKTLKESERVLEEKVNERTKELFNKNVSLKMSTEKLQESAKELDTLDKIVKIINREIEFGKVMNALLDQGLKLIPQAQHGAALIFDPNTESYHFISAIGYELERFKNKSMTIGDIKATFLPMSSEVERGIYIIREKNDELSDKVIFKLTKSKSILAMSISLEGQLAGFLVFDNNTSFDAFDQSDAHKLNRFRSHAISAFAKAKLLQEMKKVTDEMIKTQDQLIVQEKMASLGQLTAGIAHEIKNPLNFVNNFAEGSVELTEELNEALNKNKDNLKTEDYKYLEEIINDLKQNAVDILDNGKRADSIVRSMMDHARGSKGERQAVDINTLIEENVNLAYHSYRAMDSSFNVTIQKNYDKAISPVEMIQPDIGRVMLNILNNACYAVMEKWKEKGDKYSPEITVSTKPANGEVEVRIRDNGPGIPPKVRDKIFNPFFTTKPTGAGNTGLGLSISYDIIVQQHYGKLKIESESGEFTEFIITLPKNEDKK